MTSPTPFAEGAATCAKNAQVQPAPAAMPNEEEIALLINTGIVASFRAGVSEATAVYTSIGKDLLDLFAPILAEKERLGKSVRELAMLLDKQMGTPCEQIRHQQDVEALEARALAAEAAARAVLEHRVGDLPTAGYLRDNNASRKALAALAQIAAPGAAMEE